MEVEVDVHTVCPAGFVRENEVVKKGPYESWGTPEGTPIREIKRNNSKLDENIKEGKEPRFLQSQRIRLFASSPEKCRLRSEKASITELDDLQKSPKYGNKVVKPIKKVQLVETPQSPVPSSPSRVEKCKLLRLPPFFDPYTTIDPQGRMYISWLFLVTFCYSYNAWCVALRASFPYQTPDNIAIWMTADYLSDLVYLLDLVLVKPRLMYLNEGFWVDDPKETKKYYKKKLQFKFDAISLLPLDVLYCYFGPQRVILRFPRLLKLQTFWEFHQAMDRVLSSPYVVRIGKTLFYIFYLIHLNACAYYSMSDYIGLGSNGWVYDNKGNAYIRCFYFATKTATSIGKNPKPENTIEYLFMTAAWLMGVFVFALLIGQIRDIIATATRAKTEYRNTVDACSWYLRKLNLPVALQRRVACWFNYTWNQQRCFDEAKILNSLPFNMKRDVALEVHMSILSKVQLFRDCSSSLLRELVLQLRPLSALPGEAVVRRGDVGHHMYIVMSGECFVMSPDECEILAVLRTGSVFGEISLLGIDGLRRRTATVRSRGYSTLFVLSRNDLDAALKHHHEAAQVLRIRADQIIRENAARQALSQALAAPDPATIERLSAGQTVTVEPDCPRKCGQTPKVVPDSGINAAKCLGQTMSVVLEPATIERVSAGQTVNVGPDYARKCGQSPKIVLDSAQNAREFLSQTMTVAPDRGDQTIEKVSFRQPVTMGPDSAKNMRKCDQTPKVVPNSDKSVKKCLNQTVTVASDPTFSTPDLAENVGKCFDQNLTEAPDPDREFDVSETRNETPDHDTRDQTQESYNTLETRTSVPSILLSNE